MLNIWCWRGTASHAESLSVYLTGMMMIQLVPLLQPHSHLMVSMQDSNLQGTCVASCSVLSVTFWSRPLPTIAWTAAGLIWLIQARGERDKLILITSGKTTVKPPGFKSQFQHHSVSHAMTEDHNKEPTDTNSENVVLLHYSSEDTHFC